MHPDIAQTIASVIHGEERENENKINLARMFVLILMATLMTISRLVQGEPMHKTFLVIAPASLLYLLLVFFLWRHFARKGYPSSVSNIFTSLDLAYIVITLVGVSRMDETIYLRGIHKWTAVPYLISVERS